MKRARPDENETEALLKIRKLVCEENEAYAFNAHDAVRIMYGKADDLRAGRAHIAHPEFVHQLFPAQKVFGYENPHLTIYYSDPDLSIAALGAASRATQPVLSEDAGGRPLRVAPDNILSCIEDALPANFPASTSFTTVLGAPQVDKYIASGYALPASVSLFPGSTTSSGSADWRPPGVCLLTYTDTDGASFVIHRWRIGQSAETRSYHERMQTLALWYIETASNIDVTDPAWVVYATYRVNAGAFSFVGYMSVYRFTNPVRALPDTLRLAQLLLLPHQQRRGHGEKLMEVLHIDAARGGMLSEPGPAPPCTPDPDPTSHPCADLPLLPRGRVQDVTVESPCEGMVRLRDRFDVRRAYEARVFNYLAGWEDYGGAGSASSGCEDGGAGLCVDRSNAELEMARAALRVTASQAQRAYHALLLARIDRTSDSARRMYRLLIKRYVFRSDAEVEALTDVAARKLVLEDRYKEVEAQLMGALSKVQGSLVSASLLPSRTIGPLVSREEADVSQKAWDARQAEIEAAAAGQEEE